MECYKQLTAWAQNNRGYLGPGGSCIIAAPVANAWIYLAVVGSQLASLAYRASEYRLKQTFMCIIRWFINLILHVLFTGNVT